jgi:hypothetical protein
VKVNDNENTIREDDNERGMEVRLSREKHNQSRHFASNLLFHVNFLFHIVTCI